MKNDDSILQETLKNVRDLYTPANDPISKIQLRISVAMLKGMLATQKKVEKLGTTLASSLQKRIKTKEH